MSVPSFANRLPGRFFHAFPMMPTWQEARRG